MPLYMYEVAYTPQSLAAQIKQPQTDRSSPAVARGHGDQDPGMGLSAGRI